jgi:ribosome maturation factor RimP
MARLPDRLLQLLTPPLEQLGYEILQLDWRREGKEQVFCLRIDRPEGVNLDDCLLVNGAIEPILDKEDLIKGTYRLEVSTPGVDRPLRTLTHYQRFQGERITLLLYSSQQGHKRWTGTLQATNDQSIVLQAEQGPLLEISLQEIHQAHLDPILFG